MTSNEGDKLDSTFKPNSGVDYSNEIAEWLDSKDKLIRDQLGQIVYVLYEEWQIKDQDRFEIPYHKFNQIISLNSKDLESFLISLDKKEFISIMRKAGETPPSEKLQLQIWKTLSDDPNILIWLDTQVEINRNNFKQLVRAFGDIYKYKSEVSNSQPISIQTKQTIQITNRAIRAAKKNCKLGKKEMRLLDYLSDLKPHTIVELVDKEITKSANSLSKLKNRVNEKLHNSNLNIELLVGNFSDLSGSYKLKNLTPDDLN